MAIVLAFSGGLDTSFCVPYLQATHDTPVHTVTVDTGGLTDDDRTAIEARARHLGADRHHLIDGRAPLYEDHLSYLIKGNVLKGGVYPLCVGPERIVQARAVAEVAQAVGASTVAHGSTGAGNDQVRFDVALQLVGDDLDVIAPIRELGLSRDASTAYLEARGFSVPDNTTDYSINRGLWGTTIGGKETLTAEAPLPTDAYPDTTAPADAPDAPRTLTITFANGLPVAVDDASLSGVEVVETLNEVGGRHGVGRDVHVGDTILGIKGRIGVEAPAAQVLITAHRELEKVVLSEQQQVQKKGLGDVYGRLLHEGQYFDPVMRDVEAFLDHSQDVVAGTVTVKLFKGRATVQGVDSPHSLFDAGMATYGEENALWDGRDAEGYTTLAAVPSLLAKKARADTDSSGSEPMIAESTTG
ncbi:argininosuccinate synthase [Salinibacter ruber]|uniref:argininosuccinate synthase n=1 Tax=Salinibacter ruber TaxID=146919 RepID=UPI00160BD808|nr:argininosuccinate synthase [Salinibacter ruber]MBB4061184.1 argininosuccinate synthase [Salinibacter ruber]MCS3934225.1 argininosuccinate synthase [Salinibacter ruber]MCS4042147.1 argininosuccinate synthase [Salinibacter ruber]